MIGMQHVPNHALALEKMVRTAADRPRLIKDGIGDFLAAFILEPDSRMCLLQQCDAFVLQLAADERFSDVAIALHGIKRIVREAASGCRDQDRDDDKVCKSLTRM